ncbi:MAG: UDP-N-acetylglucosamine--N-acetylmuramyl-(pentapeptide) pyrophosphoryl-undecaprenol N-acetylglucosamine transferase [Lentisphaeria bacterium]|nr:UDP-N-acetylglucosamine--N-acetylmuramyl-(pentapeptide) pyrophosphoryl-undecaprenol N-acetylglucosamine transferase [Lentisphaeria bacterium]
MTNKSGHLVIATGGTGGHFYPGLAVARAFQRQGGTVSLVVSGQHAANHIEAARKEGVVAFPCPAFKLPKGPSSCVCFGPRILFGVFRAKTILKQLGADFVLGMGSFASFPPCMAAVLSRLPLFLHDGNAVVGQANRFLSRWADCLALSLPLAPGQSTRCPTKVTGMPVRQRILQAVAVPEEKDRLSANLGLNSQRKTLLIFGGSQGAAFINNLACECAPRWGQSPVQIIHLTGQEDNRALVNAYAAAGIPAVVKGYEPAMEKVYAVADWVMCRSGGGTLAELALFGLPPVLIPIPGSSLDHQRLNAAVLERAGAAVVLDQKTLTPADVNQHVTSFFETPATWSERADKIRSFATPRAASAIVDMIYVETGKKRRRGHR